MLELQPELDLKKETPALQGACASGRTDLIDFVLDADSDWSLAVVCRYRYSDLIDFIVEKSKDSVLIWNPALSAACDSKHLNLVKLAIERGAAACQCGKSLEQHL